jgi:abnormal spindle-like microcephaly-associated protein
LNVLRQQHLQLVLTAIKCQRFVRYKIFKNRLETLKRERLALTNISATRIQKCYRMYKFRRQMRIYREAALKIQLWYRQDMCERRYFLRLRKAAITIQVKYREIYARKFAAAIMIQKTFRMYLMRREFVLEVRSAVSIQRWFRSKKERIMYLRLKRSLPHVQKKCVEYVKKRNDAATLIQKAYRMYKFRRQMNLYRKAAVCIQKWHRNMSLR